MRSVAAELMPSFGFMLRMLTAPPRAIGFPSSPVTVRPTAALAAPGVTTPATRAALTASRAARPLRCVFKVMPPFGAGPPREHQMRRPVAFWRVDALVGGEFRSQRATDQRCVGIL